MDIDSIEKFFSITHNFFSTMFKALEYIPDSPKKAEAVKQIAEAEEQLDFGEIQAAEALGYQICRCTWPPQIMTLGDDDVPVCPLCKRSGVIEASANSALIENTPPPPEDAVNETEARILQVIAGLGDHGYPVLALVGGLNMIPVKLEYYLKKMCEKELLNDSLAVGQDTEYYLSTKGTEYLVKNNLI